MLSNLFPKYHPLNLIVVSRSALIANYKTLSNINSNIKIAPVLKSNAYGHGLVQVAKTLDRLKPPFFCVDSLYEAYELYKARIKTPILIMGYVDPLNLRVKKLPFMYVVSDLSLLEAIGKYQPGSQVHLKIDTGMNRMGVPLEETRDFIKSALKVKNVKINGVMSHLAETSSKSKLTKKQLENFKKALDILYSLGVKPTWRHLLSSGAILNLKKRQIEQLSNVARTGLAVYGIDPDGKYNKLKPALSLQSKIVQIKTVRKGDSVGYGGTYKAKMDIKLAILPIGYNDGLDRRLSNKGFVSAGNLLCPIIGRVSMNITAINISKVKNPKIGQIVTIYSPDRKKINSIENAATTIRTISYDLLVHLSPTTIKRAFI